MIKYLAALCFDRAENTRNFLALSPDIFLVSADKAYISIEELRSSEPLDPHLAVHGGGCFSFMCNFHVTSPKEARTRRHVNTNMVSV